jgi:hypothetical protein
MTNIFLDNKYTNWYFAIINNSKNNSADEYLEKHHIIPRSLGGNNTKDNIAKLTAKQHFICHLLLIKMTTEKARSKMLMAAWAMGTLHGKNHQGRRHKMSSRTFESLRKEALTDSNRIENLKEKFSKEKNPFYGKAQSDEAREKMSIAKKGKYKGNENHFYGKTHSEETRKRMSESRKAMGWKLVDGVRVWFTKEASV